jgi:hypothetical protein
VEASGPFGNLAGALVRLLVQAGSAILMVVLAWKFLKIMLTGGNDRAVMGLVVNLVVIGVCVAALSNLALAGGVVIAVGNAIWEALRQMVEEAL